MTTTKQQILQRQFHQARCIVVCPQETIHKRIIVPNNEHYYIVGHPADEHGADGVQLWFSKTLLLDDSGPCIQLRHLTVIDSGPTFLIVKLRMPNFRAIFITGRAPHAGKPPARDYMIYFLGDTNGHLGEHVTAAVGPHGAVREGHPGQVAFGTLPLCPKHI